jgi:hypothetical protein
MFFPASGESFTEVDSIITRIYKQTSGISRHRSHRRWKKNGRAPQKNFTGFLEKHFNYSTHHKMLS